MQRPALRSVSIIAIAAAGIPAAVPAASVGVREHGRCVSAEANPYVGIFRWRNARSAEPVRFRFDRTEPAGDGVLKATGRAA